MESQILARYRASEIVSHILTITAYSAGGYPPGATFVVEGSLREGHVRAGARGRPSLFTIMPLSSSAGSKVLAGLFPTVS